MLIDILHQLGWESYGLGYTLDSSAERQRAVNESRRLWKYSVIAQWEIGLWTSFGLGESLVITPTSEEPQSEEKDEDGNPIPLACTVWEEFWTADRNAAILAPDGLSTAELSRARWRSAPGAWLRPRSPGFSW